MKVGIIGNGFVGNATTLFRTPETEVIVFDTDPKKCEPIGITMHDLLETQLLFICVPTPMKKNGECFLSIVENVISSLHDMNYTGFIIVRSTVPVGTCDRLGCFFSPEFLTEKNYKKDFVENQDWIFGYPKNIADEKKQLFILFIKGLLNKAVKYNAIVSENAIFVQNTEAEMVKLMKNCFLATKIAFCNEVYEYCNHFGIEYENVRQLVTLDNRIGESHSYVPGHDGKKGFGGTCFPKDMNNMKYEMTQLNLNPVVITAAIHRNETIDRIEEDWKNDKGRAVI
jgi:UDPglucose 6-dehydrogenase